MKIKEILKKENIGKVLYCKDLKENYKVVEAPIEFGSNEKVLELINIVDWSKIDVDTKVLIIDSLEED